MVADTKLRAIRNILKQEVYTKDSGLYQMLEEQLNKMSCYSLQRLELIIEIKIKEVIELREKKLEELQKV